MIRKDLTGKRFSRLLVIGIARVDDNRNSKWKCICDCGNKVTVARPCLVQNHTKSCGCYQKEVIKTASLTHGMSYTMAYRRWSDMHARCTKRNGKTYKCYGARGITVCDRWKSFESFFKDMGSPKKGMSLERIDNDKGYSKNNCKWATSTEQARNRRNSISVYYNGKTASLVEWADKLKFPYATLNSRYNEGWSIKRVLTTPIEEMNTRMIHKGDIRKSLKGWSLYLGGNIALVSNRLLQGWSINRAISQPRRGYVIR